MICLDKVFIRRAENMRMKQKGILLILSLIIFSSLTGCIIIPRYKYYNIDVDDVSSIEIYHLSENERWYGDIEEPGVYMIEEEEIDEFLDDLSDIRFSDHIIIVIAAIDPSFDYGEWVVRVNYIDGSYSFLSCAGYGEAYDQNNELIRSNHYGCDDEEWKQLIKRYVPVSIFYNQDLE